MNIQLFVVLYLISVPVFFIIDMLWLGVFAKDFYQSKLGHLLGEVQWGPAILFYLLFLLGLTYFATYPAVAASSVIMAVTLGAAFGFFTYMTYDLTNLATLKDWPLSIVLVDIVWGTALGALVATVVYFIKQLV
jgi:uncharacterized membrane protein